MLPLPNGKFQFNELGIILAQEFGFKEGWKNCCKWILKLIEKHTFTHDSGIDMLDLLDFLESIENELGIKESRDKKRKKEKAENLKSILNNLIKSGNVEKATDIAVENRNIPNCKHSLSCERICTMDFGYPAWLSEGNNHKSKGWIPCEKFTSKEIEYHCAHICADGTCVWRKSGQPPHKCIGYNNCENYVIGEEIINGIINKG
jgi:hypothetical protein